MRKKYQRKIPRKFNRLKPIKINRVVLSFIDLIVKEQKFRIKYNIPYFKNRSEFVRFVVDSYIKSYESGKNNKER